MPRTAVCCHVRWLIRRDMEEVVAIDAASFDVPWSEEDYLRCLRERNCIGMTAEAAGAVVGCMLYESHERRLHVLRFAVAPAFRRLGVGTTMVRKLVGKLSPRECVAVTLEVSERNGPGVRFWRALGFRATRLLRGYYGPDADGYAMRYRVAGGDPP